jgi:hypothetical protein
VLTVRGGLRLHVGFAFDSAGRWQVEVSREGVTTQLAIPVVER